MRAAGALVKQIAYDLKCDEATVRRICKAGGVGKVFSTHPTSVKSRRLYAINGRHGKKAVTGACQESICGPSST